jgi:hypothetical protein
MKIVLPIFAITAGALAAEWLGAADSATLSEPVFQSESDPSAAMRRVAVVAAESGTKRSLINDDRNQPPAGETSQTTAKSTEAQSAGVHSRIPSSNQATEILDRTIATFVEATSISTRLRHRIHLFEHELIGSGLYEQQGQGDQRRLRLELKIQLGDKLASQLQVADDRYLWTYQDTSTGPLITQLDLNRVETAQRKAYGQSTLSSGHFATGGLPKLLIGLRDNFVFTKVEGGYLGTSAVWALEGSWRPERLSVLLPDQQARLASGDTVDFNKQPQLPERVVLFVTQETAFPQRIEFHRRTGGNGGDKNPEFAPAVTIEFLDVRFNEPIDVRQFVYQPGRQPVADVTESYLQTRGLAESK